MMKNVKHIPTALIFLVAFILIGLNVKFNSYFVFHDKGLFDFINSLITKLPLKLVIMVTNLGMKYAFYTIAALCVLFFIKKMYKEIVILLLSIEGGLGLCFLAKHLFTRLRPIAENPVYHAQGFSFPSSHAVMSVCFYGFLVYLAYLYIDRKVLKISLMTVLVILILLIGLSRILLGVHYPTDILGGYCLGLFWLKLNIMLYDYLDSHNPKIIKS